MNFRRHKPPRGARPGTLADVSQFPRPVVNAIQFDDTDVIESSDISNEEIANMLGSKGKVWFDVQGLGDEKRLLELAELFDLHELVIADVANVPQRPKSEVYEDHHFCVTRMVWCDEENHADLHWEQASVIVGNDWVLSFVEDPGDVFEPVRARLRTTQGALRTKGIDYLAYSLIDAVIDAYFPVVEELGSELDALEEQILRSPSPTTLTELARVKSDLSKLRRVLWPQRDALQALLSEDTSFASPEVRIFLRDTYDHCNQLTEVVESYREQISGLTNTYLSVVANRTNDVMKVLTIMTTIFIPLSFIAGVYGMNFEFMPELHMRLGYPIALGLMFLTAVAMLYYFQRKGWLVVFRLRPPRLLKKKFRSALEPVSRDNV